MSELITVDKDVLAKIITTGDLTGLTIPQQTQYYFTICERVGLDPTTKPFDLLKLNGKLVLYANKCATQQLSDKHGISHEILHKERIDGIYIVTVRAKMGDRYTDEDGAVNIEGLKGDNMANAVMKAATKAKRRAVLALLGLNMLDESELDTIPKSAQQKIELTLEQEKEYTDGLDTIRTSSTIEALQIAFAQMTEKYKADKIKLAEIISEKDAAKARLSK